MSRAICLLVAALACLSTPAFAGQNAGAAAFLSWSPTARVVDLCPAPAAATLYVLFGRITSFKGAEVHLQWRPASTDGCFQLVAATFPKGTSCTYLNRGTVVPVTITDDEHSYSVAWASNECLTGCSYGAALALQFAFDACSAPAGCIVTTFAEVLDCNNEIDVARLAGRVATVCGGGTACQRRASMEIEAAPAPESWGAIKALYRN